MTPWDTENVSFSSVVLAPNRLDTSTISMALLKGSSQADAFTRPDPILVRGGLAAYPRALLAEAVAASPLPCLFPDRGLPAPQEESDLGERPERAGKSTSFRLQSKTERGDAEACSRESGVGLVGGERLE